MRGATFFRRRVLAGGVVGAVTGLTIVEAALIGAAVGGATWARRPPRPSGRIIACAVFTSACPSRPRRSRLRPDSDLRALRTRRVSAHTISRMTPFNPHRPNQNDPVRMERFHGKGFKSRVFCNISSR